MDREHQNQLEEQLRVARRLYHHDKMIQARSGISCDPSVLMRIEDREKEIAQLEARLGIRQPEPPPPPRRREYVAPAPRYRPEPELERQRNDDTAHHVKLLGIHRKNLAHYIQQARAFGGIDFAPPVARHGIEEARQGIAKEKHTLRGMGVPVDDFEGE